MDLFGSLAGRAAGEATLLLPRPVSRFAPPPAALPPGGQGLEATPLEAAPALGDARRAASGPARAPAAAPLMVTAERPRSLEPAPGGPAPAAARPPVDLAAEAGGRGAPGRRRVAGEPAAGGLEAREVPDPIAGTGDERAGATAGRSARRARRVAPANADEAVPAALPHAAPPMASPAPPPVAAAAAPVLEPAGARAAPPPPATLQPAVQDRASPRRPRGPGREPALPPLLAPRQPLRPVAAVRAPASVDAERRLAPAQGEEAAPVIEITIGRVEVRAVTAAAPKAAPAPVRPRVSLEAYLRRRPGARE